MRMFWRKLILTKAIINVIVFAGNLSWRYLSCFDDRMPNSRKGKQEFESKAMHGAAVTETFTVNWGFLESQSLTMKK